MSQKHWSQIGERGSLIGLRFLLGVYKVLGKYPLWVCLFPVVFYFYLTDKNGRSASKQFLKRVSEYQKNNKVTHNQVSVLKHYCTFADAAFDKLDAWLGNIGNNQIVYSCPDAMENIAQQGKGAIFIGSHLGNLEVCRAMNQDRYGTKINVLVFTQHAIKFNQLLKDVADDVDLNMIQVSSVGPDTAMLLKEKVEQGEIVVIVGDRTSQSVAGRVIYSPFLGLEAPFSQGPFILAALLECPIYWLFCFKEGRNFKVCIEHVTDKLKLPRKQRQEVLSDLIASYAGRLEYYAMKYPFQWFNFYDFWQRDNSAQRVSSKEDK
ncbi:acyltransferase [Pseudoalteromonas luteoviolacea]|nr:acyltransferase [Pseudoalteromonas luteoviolacea]